MFSTLRAVARDPEGKFLLISAVGAVAVGTVVYSILEDWSPLDSFYFSVVTLATVGFGDLHPVTNPGKLFTVGYVLAGVGILAAFVSELAKFRQTGEKHLILGLRSDGDADAPEAPPSET